MHISSTKPNNSTAGKRLPQSPLRNLNSTNDKKSFREYMLFAVKTKVF